MSKLVELLKQGQSVWLDYIDRDLVEQGGLGELVGLGVRGVTSNPSIFQKAITGSNAYDDTVRNVLQADPQASAETLYELLTLQDVQSAADILRGVYDSSKGNDGYVSHEVSPHLAHDTQGTIDAARHLWREVHRPNLMIKVPATPEGLPAIEQLIGEGINVNVTLLFSVARYEEVFHAWLRGLAANPEPGHIASVASFFVSRVDNMVDPALEAIGSDTALVLRGKTAIANAAIAWLRFAELAQSREFIAQRERGARVQRLLWGSTSTKNPAYADTLYVDELIGPDTVNTLPPNTLDAFQQHGTVRRTIDQDPHAAAQQLKALAKLGIDLGSVTQRLEDEGVAKFAADYDVLLLALRKKVEESAKEYAAS
ncbi:MAG: transaldolase [Pseudomonadota bacterium]|nr:MAG: transaldolase [Pseudomonadota bacterium]